MNPLRERESAKACSYPFVRPLPPLLSYCLRNLYSFIFVAKKLQEPGEPALLTAKEETAREANAVMKILRWKYRRIQTAFKEIPITIERSTLRSYDERQCRPDKVKRNGDKAAFADWISSDIDRAFITCAFSYFNVRGISYSLIPRGTSKLFRGFFGMRDIGFPIKCETVRHDTPPSHTCVLMCACVRVKETV